MPVLRIFYCVFYAVFFCYIPGFFSAAEKFSQNPQGMGNYFKESNDGLWNWISLRYSDQSSPYFSGIVLQPTWLNHTNSGFSFKDLLSPDYAVLKVRGSARGCSGGSRGGAQGVRAPLIWRSGSATGLLPMVHESVHKQMLKFVFLPSVSCGSAFYGQIWLIYASCWISIKNEFLRRLW